jgi:hypothetical protein
MLKTFAMTRPASAMPVVLELAQKFKTRWRFFSKILQTMEQFPRENIQMILKDVLKMIEQAVTINPQSLMRSVISFYAYVIHSRFENMKFNDFLAYLHIRYATSDRFQDRIVYIRLAGAMMNEFDHPTFLRDIWPHIKAYKHEVVTFVRAKVLEFLILFGNEFKSLESQAISQDMYEIVAKYEGSTDVHIKEMIARVYELILPRRSISSMSGLDKLSVSSAMPVKPQSAGLTGTGARVRAPSMKFNAEQMAALKRGTPSGHADSSRDGMKRSKSLRMNLSRNS